MSKNISVNKLCSCVQIRKDTSSRWEVVLLPQMTQAQHATWTASKKWRRNSLRNFVESVKTSCATRLSKVKNRWQFCLCQYHLLPSLCFSECSTAPVWNTADTVAHIISYAWNRLESYAVLGTVCVEKMDQLLRDEKVIEDVIKNTPWCVYIMPFWITRATRISDK
jgi:hypothetical protein